MSDNKFTVELDWDTLDKIVISQIKEALEYLEIALEGRKNPERALAIFDIDVDKDTAEIEKHIEAMKLTLSWFGSIE